MNLRTEMLKLIWLALPVAKAQILIAAAGLGINGIPMSNRLWRLSRCLTNLTTFNLQYAESRGMTLPKALVFTGLVITVTWISLPAVSAQGGFALPVEVATVARTVLEQRIETVGTLHADEAVVLRPELAGRVEKILFEEGQPIEVGAKVLVLDTAIHEAELADAKARSLLARSEYQRNKDVSSKGLGSAQDLDRARAELLRARAGETLAQVRLDKMTLHAPFSGILGLRRVSPGDLLQPGDEVVELVAVDRLKLDFQIPERHAANVRVGQKVLVRVDAWPDRQFEGELYAIAPQANEGGRSLVLRAHLGNEDRALRPGMFARIDLIMDSGSTALTIPEQAIMPEGEQRFVYKINEGKAVKTAVTIGRRESTRVEILEGLADRDQVVTGGQIKLQNGTDVQPMPPAEG